MTNLSSLLLIIFSIIVMSSCNNSSKSKSESDSTQHSISQDKSDLLVGITKAIAYSGFRSGQHPDRGDGAVNPTDENILEDLTILTNADFHLIRLYDCGENSQAVIQIIAEKKLDMKVMLGVWLKAELSAHETCAWLTEPIPQDVLDKNKIANLEELQRGISLANSYPDVIVAVNVGNEALVEWNDHKMDVDTVISYVQTVKNAIEQPVTVAENYEWWAAHGENLAAVVDFVSVHVYPVWEGKDIEEGMSYSIENMQKVRDALPESKLVISEAGWASVASEFGERASEEKQKQYYDDLMKWATENNITTFFFEAFDEDWKGDPGNSMGAEKHWGLYTVDRNPKKVMQ
jgi:exo-beta-1,3-glucanase (GH17 family)